jgi:hypothetical protein
MTDHTASLFMALVTGTGAGLMQAASPETPAISMMVPIISAVVGGAISYGILRGTVQTMERDVHQMRRDMGHIYDLIRDASDRIARIEGRIERDHG